MSFTSLKDFISTRTDDIIREMRINLSKLPQSPYMEFLLQSEEGRRRLKIWLDLVIRAMDGDCDSFYEDQDRVGYARAIQGFRMENMPNYMVFQKIVWDLLKEETKKNVQQPLNYDEISRLYDILFQGYGNIAFSFLRTREEKIAEQVIHLQELRDFTNDIIRTFNLKEIVHLVLRKITSTVGVEKSFFAIYRDHYIQETFSLPKNGEHTDIKRVIEKTIAMKSCFFIDENGDSQKEIDNYILKRIVSIPVEAHGRLYGVLALQNTEKGFKFTRKELDLVYQFLFIAAIALENAFMMEEVERSRQELRLLTDKIVTIQEEERRLLAGDIHDTLAQTLTGISYKIEFCKELFKREPTALLEELDDLLKTVYGAIDQSREIISSLRPDLIDTIGLVPALIRYTTNFENETGIRVEVDFPDKIVLSSKLNICLFRIAQEALMNIYKHAETERAKMNLIREDSHVILAISDDGKGFDATKSATWIRDQNRLGLLSMKERVEAAGGAFFIKTQLGDGCTIEATIPLENERSLDEAS